ncbi:MAG: hypothetical protein WD069_14360 [Planctomycetales bacterium]
MAADPLDHAGRAPRGGRPAFRLETLALAVAVPAVFALAVAGWPVADARQYVPEPPHAAGVTFAGVTAGAVGFLCLNYALTAVLGYALVAPFFRGLRVSWPVRVAASFLPGFLGFIALARILSLFLGGWPLSAALAAAIGGIAAVRARNDWRREADGTVARRDAPQPPFDWTTGLFLAGAVLFVGLVLMLQVYQNHMFWVGHGTQQYARHLVDWHEAGRLHRFPIVRQHYDELLYHYAIGRPFLGRFDPIIPWWITLALTKLSTYALLFSAFRAVRVGHWPAVAFATFCMLGTFFPPGTQYYLLFDSANPLAMVVHSGRIAGVALVVLLIADRVRPTRGNAAIGPAAWFLLALGLTATSLSNIAWLLAFAFLLALWPRRPLDPVDGATRRELAVSSRLIVASAAICPILYALPFAHPYYLLRLGLAIAPPAIWGIVSLREFLRTTRRDPARLAEVKSRLRRLAVPVAAAAALGLVLLGNLFAGRPNNGFFLMFRALMSAIGLPLGVESLNVGMATGSWLDLGDHRELAEFPETYARNGPYFVAYYGLLLLMMLAGNRWLAARVRGPRRLGAGSLLLYRVFSFAIVCLPLLFLFVDFVGVGERAAIKLRFLEIPVYAVVFGSCCLASRFARRPARRIVLAAAVLYSVAPFLGTGRPQQIWMNLRLFLDMLRSA